jgi:hypothetical protein
VAPALESGDKITRFGPFSSQSRLHRVRSVILTAPATVSRGHHHHPCPCCGGRMIIIEIFECGCSPRYHPTVPNWVDSS